MYRGLAKLARLVVPATDYSEHGHALFRPPKQAGREGQSVKSPVLMEEIGFNEPKAQRVLKALLDSGLLRGVGWGPATRYEVVRP